MNAQGCQKLAFADLDDTLFQTLRKLPAGVDVSALYPATVNTAGEPHSFMTQAQFLLLETLRAGGFTIVPVTGRDSAAFARLTFAGQAWPFGSWCVLDHGLTVLNAEGKPDATWAAQVRSELKPLQSPLLELTDWLRPRAEAAGCRLRLHHVQGGLPFMAVLKHPQADPTALAELQGAWAAELSGVQSLRVIANANNVSLLPARVGKAEAVAYLRRTQFPNAALTIGLGDSVSDLDFMAGCDFALVPQRSQILWAVREVELPQQ